MIGYSGTGYKGMQIDNKQKTIEGDLFTALVAAGAISKANASDPKKSSLVRCARTDKGVHAAGNVVSLKLIIEDVTVSTPSAVPDTKRVKLESSAAPTPSSVVTPAASNGGEESEEDEFEDVN
jgi:tRNA pseudouridine(38-40) synthase